jgi:hypothetical protein
VELFSDATAIDADGSRLTMMIDVMSRIMSLIL